MPDENKMEAGRDVATSNRRDLSPDGLAFRDLVEDVLGILASSGQTLSEEDLRRAREVVEGAVVRFEHDRDRVHGLKQILTVFSLVEGREHWSQAHKMVLEVVRKQGSDL